MSSFIFRGKTFFQGQRILLRKFDDRGFEQWVWPHCIIKTVRLEKFTTLNLPGYSGFYPIYFLELDKVLPGQIIPIQSICVRMVMGASQAYEFVAHEGVQ